MVLGAGRGVMGASDDAELNRGLVGYGEEL